MESNLTQAKDQSPWLAFAVARNNGISFQSYSSDKVRHHQQLPPGYSGTICGSSGGFLIMADQNSDQISLIDPLKKVVFKLPPISASYSSTDSRQHVIVHKAVVSSPPFDCVVMIIYGEQRELAYYKPGNQTWTKLEKAGSYFDDVIFDKGEFYGVDEYGRVVTCRPGYPPSVQEIVMPWNFRGDKVYLVAINRNLYVVIRFLKDNPNPTLGYETYNFEVRLLNWDGGCRRVGNIEDWVIFLGQNESIALSTQTFKGFKGNCIYFTDDNWESYKYGGHDSGVFDMKERSFQPLKYPALSRPVWLI
ncbi:hypothetical protein COLO4_36113 [Corchorus olitorius]|uniref:KIB1-4 beta-propeller domain-containing protein n=1 Tax=Corchorus olitorius TaxID=93759 RepID=A0A1R3GAZ2_9ROSI|nr:hypothetical protein COLO4_36113 [Corchorus olitorius]